MPNHAPKSKLLLSQLAEELKAELKGKDREVRGLCALDELKPDCLTFSKGTTLKSKIHTLDAANIAGLLVRAEDFKYLPNKLSYGVIAVKDPLHAIITCLPHFHSEYPLERSVSSKADVHANTKIGKNVHIGAFASIGELVKIEDDVTIFPQVTIYPGAQIGRGSIIHSGAIIREDCVIGAGSIIQNGAIIGADGFGYIPDPESGLKKVPQVGNVSIGTRVEVGANTCIDRATLGTTQVGEGTKIDNLVQLGHNVKIGEHSILCGMVGVAGSANIGKQVVLGAATKIADHVTIVDGCRTAGGSEIRSDLTKRADYGGTPAVPLTEWKRQVAALRRLPEIVKKLRPRAKNFITLFLVCSSLVACKKEEVPTGPADVTLQIAHGPELRSFLSTVREQFYLTNPILPDGSIVRVELIGELGVNAAKRLANGDLKNDAWIAPSTTYVNMANHARINLGAEQGKCLPLFKTPIIVAVKSSQVLSLGAREQTFSWQKMISSALLQTEGSPQQISFSHAQPRNSTTGLASLLQLAYLTSGNSELSPNIVTREDVKTKLKSIEQLVFSYPLSESFLLQKVATASDKQVRFALTTQQQIRQFNKQRGQGISELTELWPQEGSYWEDYQLCTSLADWVTPAREAALRLFAQFLTSPQSKQSAVELGFQLPTATAPTSTPSAEDPKAERPIFGAVSGVTTTALLNEWNELRRPGALILVLDQSGSMEGDSLNAAKEQFRNILALSAPHDLKAIVTFGTDAKVLGGFTPDSAQLVPPLDILQAVGGSAVYDGIKLAFDLASRNELSPYRKSIVILTDGDDKNSLMSLTSLLAYVHDKASVHAIDLIIIAINRGGANFADLERIVQAADGNLRITTLMELETTFQEVNKSL